MQMRVGAINAINFRKLAGAEGFIFVEAPKSFQQTLATQHFMDSGDATSKAIRGIEEGGIAIGDLHTQPQQLRRGFSIAATPVQLDGLSCPYRPMAQQSADDAALPALEPEGREQIGDNVVVVARVERDVVATARHHSAHN